MPDAPRRAALLGGALDAAVGRTHHIALQMDRRWVIEAGCFSQRPHMNRATAEALGIPADRCHPDWRTLLAAEPGRVEVVIVLTPTPMHAEMVCAALAAGFDVVCEKALASTVDDARRIETAQAEHGRFLAVTYNYTGYPMVREMRDMAQRGVLGDLLSVHVEMPQESFRRVGPDGQPGTPQAWRLKDGPIPTVSLDLGVHVHHLIDFLCDRAPLTLTAMHDQHGHFEGVLDDVHCLARYAGDLSAHLWFGKTALGDSNGLKVRLYGTEGSVQWYQQDPEVVAWADHRGRRTLLTRASEGVRVANAVRYERFKAGHPAGFIEAFANLYADIADAHKRHVAGNATPHPYVAGAEVARAGLEMLDAIARASATSTWVPLGLGRQG